MASLVVVCSIASGQEHSQEHKPIGRWGTQIGPEAPYPVDFGIDFQEQATLASQNLAWARWADAHKGWTLLSDPRTGQPWRSYGPGISVTAPEPNEADLRSAGDVLVRELAPTVGISPTSLRFVTAQHAGSIWFVDFAQYVGEARVIDCGMTFRIHESGQLVLWGGRFVPDHNIDDRAQVGPEAARDIARRFLTGMGYVSDQTTLKPFTERLGVHVIEDRVSRTGRLVWDLSWNSDRPAATWVIRVDAKDGSIVKWWNDDRACTGGHGHEEHQSTLVHTPTPLESILWFAAFTGTTSGTCHDGVLPSAAPVSRNFPSVRFVVDGSTTMLANLTGQYSFSNGAASNSMTSGLDGSYITTNNSAAGGAQAAFSTTATTGVVDAVWTDANSSLAERDAYFFANKIRNFIKAKVPTETLFDTTIVANVNVSGSCNAFYSPSAQTINFYPAGGACINTAYSGSVVEHEFGHHVSTRIYNSHGYSVPGHLGEGFSDAQAAAVEDHPLVGEGFQGVGTIIRNCDNTCQYPTSCGTEVHARGQLIAACYWHTRVQFSNALGAAGKAQLDTMLWQHLHGSPQSEPESILDFLVLDDTNANLNDGTPNLLKFYQGYTVQHAVPFPLAGATIAHTALPNTFDQLSPVFVRATVTPALGATITGVTLRRSINGGAYASTAMSNVGGNEWQGSIPAQAVNTKVNYYFTATDSLGLGATYPSGSPSAALSYRSARSVNIFSDDMDAVDPGWTAAATAGASDWHWQAPGNAAHAYDPATAFNGTMCRGTDLSPSGFNGNYANSVNTTLTSPPIDCTGKTGIQLTFRRWLTVENGQYDFARVQVSANGSAYSTFWVNPAGADTIDTGWSEQTLDLSVFASNQPNVRVRFNLQTDASATRGGWTVDALRVASSNTTLPLSVIGSTVGGQPGGVRISGLSGDQIYLAADVAMAATYYAGLGTLSLNLGSGSSILLIPGNVTLGVSGFTDLNFVVPAVPGVTVYFQSVLVPTANPAGVVISNLLPFTIL